MLDAIDRESIILAEELKNLTNEELSEVYDEALHYSEGFNLLLQQYEQEEVEEVRTKPFAKELARNYLINFTTYTFPGYYVNDHHEIVAEYLDKFVKKEIKHLIIVEPPRHGKTEQVSRRLPAYIFGKNPDAHIIATTYGASLSRRNNRDVQRIMDSPAYQELFPNVQLSNKNIRTVAHGNYLRNSDLFEVVGYEGSYTCSGIDGSIGGMGADFGLLDDPFKNAKEAYSKVRRDVVWEFYISTFLPRLEKDGSQLITTTRWHEDDLVGRLIEQDGTVEQGGKWTVLYFPAVKETSLNHNDYDLRDEGEILWESKYNVEALTNIWETLGEYWWNALYQGRPSPEGGGILKADWFQYYEALPDPSTWLRVIQSYDTAFEEKETNDYNVCSTWIETKDHKLYLWNIWRERAEFPKLKRMAKELYDKYNPSLILIEKKASGHSLIQELRTLRLPVKAIQVDISKTLRASVASPTIQAGNVYLPLDASWLTDLLIEVVAFPNGAFDDQVDSIIQAINYMKGNSFEQFVKVLEAVSDQTTGRTSYGLVKEEDWEKFGGNNGSKGNTIEDHLNVYEKVAQGKLLV